jgi:hypothetical protein
MESAGPMDESGRKIKGEKVLLRDETTVGLAAERQAKMWQ